VSLAPLGELLSDPGLDVVVHAGDLEVQLLAQDFGIRFSSLFDTAIAAKSLGFRRTGLATLASELLGVVLSKDEQRSDWGARPLSSAQLAYALADTRYLLPLADLLRERLARAAPEVREEVAEDAVRLSRREVRVRVVDPEAFERHPLARRLNGRQRQTLRHLYAAREDRAQALDRALFRVVSDEVLGHIALADPLDRAALDRVQGMNPILSSKVGDVLWEAIQRARTAGPLDRLQRVRLEPDPAEEARFEALRSWRRLTAETRGVDVEVIASNATLKAIARHRPSSPAALESVSELDPLRRRLYGESLLSVLMRSGA
jgi:ribonuclease D